MRELQLSQNDLRDAPNKDFSAFTKMVAKTS